MRKRVSDEVVKELIEYEGCRRGGTGLINATGIVRLALDLQEARQEVEELRRKLGMK